MTIDAFSTSCAMRSRLARSRRSELVGLEPVGPCLAHDLRDHTTIRFAALSWQH
ncbi:MAG: hypothetical protein GDA49_07425 [Rhodospirillales bacterium]|nr:hypothetical protein [Rhodospirillales bacterium]